MRRPPSNRGKRATTKKKWTTRSPETTTSEEPPARLPRNRPFIPDDVRLAIFLRDGLRCVYCDVRYRFEAPEEEHLTLEHLDPWAESRDSSPRNLVTACFSCNQERRDLALPHFCSLRAINPSTLRQSAQRPLPIEHARALLLNGKRPLRFALEAASRRCSQK